MPDPSTILVFALAALALLVVPGPSVLFVVARGIESGRRPALASAVGVGLGSLVHVALAALGLSALLTRSEPAFNAVKWAGAAYLVFLGIRALLDRRDPVVVDRPPASTAHLVRQGLVVNALNPKTALFIYAFLPQFVNPDAGPVALQIVVLGLVMFLLGLITDGTWALLSGSAGGWLQRRPQLIRRQRVVAGTVYIGLGVAAAVSGSRPQP